MHTDCLQFTYKNDRHHMASRLDFWLINLEFRQYVSKTHIKPIAICPDHCAILMVTNLSDMKRGPGYWKLNNSLLKDNEFKHNIKNIILSATRTLERENNPRYTWELCKIRIKEFSMRYAKQKRKKEKHHITQLENRYADLASIRILNGNLKKEFNEIKLEINDYYTQQCEGARIRSRVAWFEEGERNTKFFLNLEKRNGLKKNFTSVKVGKRIETKPKIVHKHVHKFYSNLYKSENVSDKDIEKYLETIKNPVLTDEDANSCEGDITEAELTLALNNMKLNKAPGIDGLTTEFYREFWPDIKELICKSINESFREGILGYSQRKGVMTLIFKKVIEKTCKIGVRLRYLI